MTDIISIDELVGPENIGGVSLTKNGIIPILGGKRSQTMGAAEAFNYINQVQYVKHQIFDFSDKKVRRNASEEVEILARLGAIAANIHRDSGKVYDFGCGCGVASIVYNLLTHETPIAIDKNEKIIKTAKRIASNEGAEVDFCNSAVEEYMGGIVLKSEDVVISSNFIYLNYITDLIKNNKFNLIFHGMLDNSLLNKIKEDWTTSGYDLKIAQGFSVYNNLKKTSPILFPLLELPNEQYIILATPKI